MKDNISIFISETEKNDIWINGENWNDYIIKNSFNSINLKKANYVRRYIKYKSFGIGLKKYL